MEAAQARVAEVLQRANLKEAGTTLAGLALFEPNDLIVFHVGDSRVLRISGGYARALTVDHTPVGNDVASGRMTEGQALEDKAGSAKFYKRAFFFYRADRQKEDAVCFEELYFSRIGEDQTEKKNSLREIDLE